VYCTPGTSVRNSVKAPENYFIRLNPRDLHWVSAQMYFLLLKLVFIRELMQGKVL